MRFTARTPVLVGVLSFLIAAGVVTIWYRLTPTPENIMAADLGSTSFRVGWYTAKPTKGCTLAIADAPWRFVAWDFLKSQFDRHYTGLYVNRACFVETANTHLATFTNLLENYPYRVAVMVGPRRVELPIGNPVITKKISESEEPPLPEPAYGGVTYEDETPVVGALVYFYRGLADEFRYPLAVVTNNDGNYAIDLANFDDSDDISTYDSYLVDVVDTEGKQTRQILPRDIHQPFPPLLANR